MIALAACGGGGGGGGDPGPGGPPADLEASLNSLGVDTAFTSRQAYPGGTVDSSYSPFGATAELSKTSELLLFGIGLVTPALTDPAVVLELTDGNGDPTADVLHAEAAAAMPWAAETQVSRAQPATLRAPVAADVDGDGLEETAIVYQVGIETRVHLIDDATAAFATRDVLIDNLTDVTNVAVAAGDLDGDGDDELLVGFTQNGSGVVQAYAFDGAQFAAVGPRRLLGPSLPSTTLCLDLCAGNLDLDRAEEFVVVVNETNSTTGQARFAVYDDLGAGAALLREDPFSGRDAGNQLRVGLSADVAIGDLDGDNIGEVLLGGVTEFTRNCVAPTYFLLVLDDAERGLADLAGHAESWFWTDCNSPSDPQIRTVFVAVLDIDGDDRNEIVANQFVFEDFATALPFTEVADLRLPQRVLFLDNDYGHFDRNTASFVTGDFTGDDRGDVAVYRQDTGTVDVYSLPETASTITMTRRVAVPFRNSQTPANPVLVAVNVDTDSPVLKYAEAEYQLVFTEPVVLAALAAPPCREGIGQNTGACFTAFGNTSTTVVEEERSLTFSAGVSVGVNIDGGALTQSEFELKATATVAATLTVGSAYELSKTIVFTSAPAEDTVVFTTVPIDRYTYIVTSHPDPDMVGQPVVIDLPRSPITLQAERGFYNRTIQPTNQAIDETVFQHTIGDLSTYPTAAQRNLLLAGGGLQIGPQSVGQGGGSTEVTLEVGREVSEGGALAVGFQIDVEATAGSVLGGISIGVEGSASWQITSGESTTYTGVVGAIDAANFAANRYSFGLFTYVHRDPVTLQEFQVLNYWIE